MSYEPPFKISAKSINLISEISANVERVKINLEKSDSIKLRKVNRIKTIRGSLAIEGNSLSEEQVTALIDGKHVIAPLKEVQEVRNAINPPADMVQGLITDLFEWLKNAQDHILIKSCVFHYEFEFIHPFEDGNGRMGRFWQSKILSEWNPIFENLPIENMIWENQAEYYRAIEKSTENSDSGIFVEFMLGLILDSLKVQEADLLERIGADKNGKWQVKADSAGK